MTVAITGANGFLGSHLVNKFLEAGCKVIALVRESADISLLPESTKLFIATTDYSSKSSLTNSFQMHKSTFGKIDYLVHNAGVTVSSKKSDYFKYNAALTKNLLESVIETGSLSSKCKIIYISSFAARGPVGFDQPVSNYGRSKRVAEHYVNDSKIPSLIVRPTAIYGEGDKAFLPLFKTASQGFYPVLAPKDQKITFIHASDLASTIVHHKDDTGVIHASDGKVYSHENVIEVFQKILDKKIRKVTVSPWLVSIGLSVADLFFALFRIKPSMTSEKFKEISKDWNLNQLRDLQQAEISNPISLSKGFENTFAYYKRNHLIK